MFDIVTSHHTQSNARAQIGLISTTRLLVRQSWSTGKLINRRTIIIIHYYMLLEPLGSRVKYKRIEVSGRSQNGNFSPFVHEM